MSKSRLWSICIGAVVVTVLAYYLLMEYRNSITPKHLEATKPLVKNIPTEVQIIPVKVAKKGFVESRQKVELPPGHRAMSTADLPASETGYGIVSTIDPETGENALRQYEKPLPAVGFPMTVRVRAGAGIAPEGYSLKVSGDFTPLRIDKAYIGIEGNANLKQNGNLDYYAGAFVEYRFDVF